MVVFPDLCAGIVVWGLTTTKLLVGGGIIFHPLYYVLKIAIVLLVLHGMRFEGLTVFDFPDMCAVMVD